eukprot:1261129-Pyramimonas_sp.AAC.1
MQASPTDGPVLGQELVRMQVEGLPGPVLRHVVEESRRQGHLVHGHGRGARGAGTRRGEARTPRTSRGPTEDLHEVLQTSTRCPRYWTSRGAPEVPPRTSRGPPERPRFPRGPEAPPRTSRGHYGSSWITQNGSLGKGIPPFGERIIFALLLLFLCPPEPSGETLGRGTGAVAHGRESSN